MNQEQVLSILRQILLFAGGFIVAKGWLDTATLTTLVGAIVTIIASIWAIWTRRNTGLVDAAAKVDGVQKILASPPIANGTVSDKVVTQ